MSSVKSLATSPIAGGFSLATALDTSRPLRATRQTKFVEWINRRKKNALMHKPFEKMVDSNSCHRIARPKCVLFCGTCGMIDVANCVVMRNRHCTRPCRGMQRSQIDNVAWEKEVECPVKGHANFAFQARQLKEVNRSP